MNALGQFIRNIRLGHRTGTNDVVYEGKAFAVKPDNLSPIPGAHMAEREDSSKSSSGLHTFLLSPSLGHTRTCAHIYTHFKKKKTVEKNNPKF